MNKKTIYTGLILGIFFLAFYFQDRYAIFSIDDWTYAFVVQDSYFNYQSVADDNVVRQPIMSFHDALLSQSRDYFKTNGRLIIHTLTQYFCGTCTMAQFVVFNSIIFAIFTLLLIQLTTCGNDLWKLLLLLSAIWILLPHKGLTMMGNITCSKDYLWGCTGNLIFLCLLHQTLSRKHGIIGLLLFVIIALIAGSLQESFSIGIAGACFILVVLRWHNINSQLKTMIIAYIVGTGICMMTPSNFRRFDDIGGMGFHSNSLLGLLSSPVFLLFIISIIYLAKKGKLKNVAQNNMTLVLTMSVFINVGFALFIAYNGRHQLTAVNVFCFIVLFRTWMPLIHPKHLKIVTALLLLTSIASYQPILAYRKQYYEAYNLIFKRAKQSQTGIVSGWEFEQQTDELKSNPILECNYVWPFTFQDWDFFERSLSVYLTKGESNQMIKEVTK